MTSTSFWGAKRLCATVAAALTLLTPAWAQSSGVVEVATPPRTIAKRGGVMDARVTVQLRNGYHVNSNAPAEDYLIPLRLTWNAAPMTVAATVFPKPKMEKYSFSSEPLSVFTGDFDILTQLKVPSSAPQGPGVLVGKLRYQACNDNSCLPPKTLEVRLPYQIQ